MYNYYQQLTKFFLFFSISFIISMLYPNSVSAIIFFNGDTHVVQDVNTPNEIYFGGSNSLTGITETGPINFTITTTQTSIRNSLAAVIGGGFTSAVGLSNTVNGDISLTINNTDFHSNLPTGIGICGAGIGLNGGQIRVNGSIFMDITNTTTNLDIFGGGAQGLNINGNQHITGSITMNLQQVIARNIIVLGDLQGSGISHASVEKDVMLNLTNVTCENTYISTEDNNNLAGNALVNVINCTINDTLGFTDESTIRGSAFMDIRNSKINTLVLTVDGEILGSVKVSIEDSQLELCGLGAGLFGMIGGPVTTSIKNSDIKQLVVGAGNQNQPLRHVTVTSSGGNITDAQLGVGDGGAERIIFSSHGTNFDTISIGANPNDPLQGIGHPNIAILNINGGSINNIDVYAAGQAVLNFTPDKKSFVANQIGGPIPLNTVIIQKNARTQWGKSGETFNLFTNDFLLSGELFITANSVANLNINNQFQTNGGIIFPEGTTPTSMIPLIHFIASPQSTLTINAPLKVNLSFSPTLLGTKSFPLATATGIFANSNLFAKRNTKGLLWSDVVFNPADNTWSLTNIRPSEDFYGLSAAREASSWLRQQSIFTIQKRSSDAFEHGTDGVWVDIQGGYEKLDTAIGKANMPWIMANMGYNFLHQLSMLNSTTLYGLSFGYTEGHDKWNSVNKTKNDLKMGMIAGYIGLMHNSGIYGTVAAQVASNRTTTKCTGFEKNYKWTETIPTESLELGWKYSFNNGININPRGKVILEQLSKHHFKLSHDNDTAILEKSMLTTTVLGITAGYNCNIGVPISLQAGVDWIQGVTGDFAAKSRLLKKKFKDKNDTTIFRPSLSINSQLSEHFNVYIDGFADIGNDKGFGGQIGTSYKF